ncbi:MAG: MIP/aquaporin family protein [Bryobacteraceae bacterium]
MASPAVGEFMGTMVLIILGDGVVASTLLGGSKGEQGGWLAITAGWGFAVMAGIFTAMACGSADAHINPAVTIALAVVTGDTSKLLPYIIAQLAGAFVGAVIVWLAYWSHWSGTANAVVKRGVFCTIPAIRSYPANLVTEIIGTAILVVVGLAFGSKAISSTGLMAGYAPILWAVLVWSIGLSLGGPTGYAINPARDLGPRIAHAILPIPGKGSSDWSYAPVPILGPVIGCVIGAIVVKLFHF